MNKKTIDILIKSLFVLALFSISFYSFAIWSDTIEDPYSGMPYPPFNIGSSPQQKIGPLNLNEIKVTSVVNLDGPLIIDTNGSVESDGNLLMSDSNGFAKWENIPSGQDQYVSSTVWDRDATSSKVYLKEGINDINIPLILTTDVLGYYENTAGNSGVEVFLSSKNNNFFAGHGGIGYKYLMEGQADAATNNVVVGYNALYNLTTGGRNTALGSTAFRNAYGSFDNVAIGESSFSQLTFWGDDESLSRGDKNVSLGTDSLGIGSITHGSVGVGINSLSNIQRENQDNYNIGIGNETKNTSSSGTNGEVSDIILIGHKAHFDKTNGELKNAVAIGSHAEVKDSNTMVFGNNTITNWGFGILPTSDCVFKIKLNEPNSYKCLDATGQWTTSSDRNKKHNIKDLSYGLDKILSLRPISFDWNGSNESDIGLIAQEVKEVLPGIVHGKEGEMGIAYTKLTPVLLKAVQEQQEEIKGYQKELEDLELRLKELQK